MSIYHCSIKIIGRSGGKSAVAAAAYRSGEKLYDKETGITHDFTKKSGVILNEIILPSHIPERFQNREYLWNEVQKVEKRKDAQLAREIEVALPVELDRDTQIKCVRKYINSNFVSEGMIADWALHDKNTGNPHAHILLTTREMERDGKWLDKQVSFFANAYDKRGIPFYDERFPTYDPRHKEETAKYRIPLLDKDGNQRVRKRKGKGTELLWAKENVATNDWNCKFKAEHWRESWAEICNRYLEEDKQLDHRSYKRQGIEQEPTIHEGVTARKIEQSGNTSERCEHNRSVKRRNRILSEITNSIKEITNYIYEKVRPIIEGIRIKRSVRPFEESRRYYFIDWLFGDKISCSRRESDRHRDTAGRIDEIKQQVEDTDRIIEITNRNIEITDQDIKRTERSINNTKWHLEKSADFIESRAILKAAKEKPVDQEPSYIPAWMYPSPDEEEYVPRL